MVVVTASDAVVTFVVFIVVVFVTVAVGITACLRYRPRIYNHFSTIGSTIGSNRKK